MSRALTLAAIAGLAILVGTVALRDPDQPYAIAAFVIGLGLLIGALVARAMLAFGRPGRSARASRDRARALRRGAGVGAIAAILVALRAIDGLSPLTAGFVVLAFVLAEVALTARTPSVR